MTCARCEELEEEVAYLKSELGLQRDATKLHNLRRVMEASSVAPRSNQAAAAVLALHGAHGRLLSSFQLLDAVPSPTEADRNPEIAKVWIHRARLGLPAGSIETVWGKGYRLTETGMIAVDKILGEKVA